MYLLGDCPFMDDAIDGFSMTMCGLRRDAKGDRVTVSIEFHEPEGLCRGFAGALPAS